MANKMMRMMPDYGQASSSSFY